MNGWDALKTCGGTLHRKVRVAGGPWLEFRGVRVEDDESEIALLYRTDLDRDDWEVEPRSVEVTLETVRKAWDENVGAGDRMFGDFCCALGLEP